MADRRRPVPARESECESEHGEGNPNEDLSEYESANEENKGGEHGEEEEEDGEDDSEETDSEEGETTEEEDDDDEDGEYSEDVVIEGEYEDGWVEEERQSGDGQEQPEATQDDLDDDEDKQNPAYVPRKGAFYEHDLRIDDTGELKEERPKKKLWKDDGKWIHDRYNEAQQTPKSREELIALYGYDIRAHDKPPDRAPRMNRKRQGNPRDERNRLGDFMTDRRIQQKTGSPPRYTNNRNREVYNNDDRPQYENNRAQYNNRQRNSYDNRQNSYNNDRRRQTYQSLKEGGGRESGGNRYNQYNSSERREDRPDNRGRQEAPLHQDVRYHEKILTQKHDDNRGDREHKGPVEREHRGPAEREHRGPAEREHRGPFDREHRGPSERDHRGHDRDQKGPVEREHMGPSDRDHRGPSGRDHRGPSDRDHRGPSDRDHRGPSDRDNWGPSDRDHKGFSRNQGGRGPRLQRGGSHGSSGDVRNSRMHSGDVRSNRSNFPDRGNDSQTRQFTNSAYQTNLSNAESHQEENDVDNPSTIQINVVNKNALMDKKSYSRERRGKYVGRTRTQEKSGFSLDQSLVSRGAEEDQSKVPPPGPPRTSPGPPREHKPSPVSNQPTRATPPLEQKAFPPPPMVVKQETGQSRPKRYSSQRQRNLHEPQYPEQSASPVENQPQAYFNQGFRPPAPMFRPEQPGPTPPQPRQEAPFPPRPMLPPQLHYPVPVSSAGLSTPPRLFAGGPPVSLPTGQPLMAPPYMPTGMMYGAPPYRMPSPVPVQNFPSPPPVTVPIPQPVQLPTQPSPAEVYRGGTTYYPPQLQQSNPNRSPVRRPKLAIPIVNPQESQFQGEGLSPQYYPEDEYEDYEKGEEYHHGNAEYHQGNPEYQQGDAEYRHGSADYDHGIADPTMHLGGYTESVPEVSHSASVERQKETESPVAQEVKSELKETRENIDSGTVTEGSSIADENKSTYPTMPQEHAPHIASNPAGDTDSKIQIKQEADSYEQKAPVESSNPDIAAGGDNPGVDEKLNRDASETINSQDLDSVAVKTEMKIEPEMDSSSSKPADIKSDEIDSQSAVTTGSETA